MDDIVVNYDFPSDIESCIHCVGKIGRGGKSGVAVSYFTGENKNLSRKLVKVTSQVQQVVPEWLQSMGYVTYTSGCS
jgi:superfamily II DNA/RNA helicase